MLKEKKICAQAYPIIISYLGDHLRFTNVEFEIEVLEKVFLANEVAKRVQIAMAIGRMHDKIAAQIKERLARGLPCPAPMKPASVLREKTSERISLSEASRILGELPHSVRRMADRGELNTTRTKRGHRRFSRDEVERMARDEEREYK